MKARRHQKQERIQGAKEWLCAHCTRTCCYGLRSGISEKKGAETPPLFWLLLGFFFWLPFLAVLLPPGPGSPGRWLSEPVHDLNVRGERADRDEPQRRKPRPRPRFSLPRCEQALKPVWRPPTLARFAGPGAARRRSCRRPWPCRACRRLCRLLAGRRSSRVRPP